MRIKLLGVRGTVPVHGREFDEFGGATSCVLVRAGEENIILDAGSGLSGSAFRAFCPGEKFSLLISHGHADHLIGFPIFPPLFDPKMSGDIYMKTRGGLSAREQIEKLMSPPLWPVPTAAAKAELRFFDVEKEFRIGEVEVSTMDANHPGGCTIYRLRYGGKTLVYATDHESDAVEPEEFAAFAKDCDLLLIDAQYTESDYARTKGFGHATMRSSAELAKLCGAKETLFIHHDPTRDDSALRALEEAVRAEYAGVRFGREREEVLL